MRRTFSNYNELKAHQFHAGSQGARLTAGADLRKHFGERQGQGFQQSQAEQQEQSSHSARPTIEPDSKEHHTSILKYETAQQQEERIRAASPYGHFKTWRLLRVIVKSGDDLRSEQFAMQLIETIDLIFKKRKLKLKLTPYEILSSGQNCGIVEFIADAFSIDYIKKKMYETTNQEADLVDFYSIKFGEDGSKTYTEAINNLADSLAAYSLVCYIL